MPARVVHVQHHPHRLAGRERRDELVGHAPGIERGHARVDADHLHVGDPLEALHDLREPPRREHERVAAREDHLPDAWISRDVVERAPELVGRERLRSRTDALAPEAEAAVDRAGVRGQQQHPVGIAVHDARQRLVCEIADRIGELVGERRELVRARHQLERQRVARIARVDRVGDLAGERDRPARRHAFQVRRPCSRHQPALHQPFDLARSTHPSSTGANKTSSIRSAPVAHITRRSKPSAMPALSGRPCSSAAMKSGSMG